MAQEDTKHISEWVPIYKISNLSTWDLMSTEVKFDNGTTCHFWDDWPLAIATHFRIIIKQKK